MTVIKVLSWTLLAVYLTVVILLNLAAVNWGTRALVTFVALIPLTIVCGIACLAQLVRRRRELAFNRRTARAVAGAMVMLALIAVIGITVGYLTA